MQTRNPKIAPCGTKAALPRLQRRQWAERGGKCRNRPQRRGKLLGCAIRDSYRLLSHTLGAFSHTLGALMGGNAGSYGKDTLV